MWERFQNAVAKPRSRPTTASCSTSSSARCCLPREEWAGAIEVTRQAPTSSTTICPPSTSRCVTARRLRDGRARVPVQPPDAGRRPQAPARQGAHRHGGQALLHAARVSDFPPNKQEPDGAGVPQVPRRRRPPAPRADPRVGAHDDGARVLHPSSQRPGLHAVVRAGRSCCPSLLSITHLLRLDLLGYGVAKPAAAAASDAQRRRAAQRPTVADGIGAAPRTDEAVEAAHCRTAAPRPRAEEDELPLSVMLDENGGDARQHPGRPRATVARATVTLNKDVLKRHAAVLGGSGSGKTTLALCLIEQLLLRGIPAVLIDRKGDLCSYANPDVWRAQRRANTPSAAASARSSPTPSTSPSITPGRASGRPISITLLPNGINELPDHEQQLLGQPLRGGARRDAASQELGDAPEAVRHAVGGAAHPRLALQQVR